MERKKKMIGGVAQAMLHDQGLPMHLWVEACNTVFYVQNHCLDRVLSMSTPEEDFTSKKPNISHFKNFGSSVYLHVTKDSKKKLELTTEFGIFLGYTETPHNYHMYFLNSKMTFI
jgi:hypothetical protein